jgi:hypothetical protein
MERIVFSPELTIPDTLVLQNLADDIARHHRTKRAIKVEGDEGYLSASSTSHDPDTSMFLLPIDSSHEPGSILRAPCRNLKTES